MKVYLSNLRFLFLTCLTLNLYFSMGGLVSEVYAAKKKNSKKVSTKKIKRSKSKISSSKDKEFMVTTNPLLLGWGVLNANLDKKLDNKSVLGGEFVHYDESAGLISLGLTAIGLKYQRHFFGKAMEDSMYLSGTGYLVNGRASVLGLRASSYFVTVGAATGYQWAWDTFSMRAGAGLTLAGAVLDFQIGAKF